MCVYVTRILVIRKIRNEYITRGTFIACVNKWNFLRYSVTPGITWRKCRTFRKQYNSEHHLLVSIDGIIRQ